MGRVFFIGAGASKPDGFPLTRDLMGAVAHYLAANCGEKDKRDRNEPSQGLVPFLETVFGITKDEILIVASCWEDSFIKNSGSAARENDTLLSWPSITTVLTAIDAALHDDRSLGRGEKREYRGNELRTVRGEIIKALIATLNCLHEERQSAPITKAFVNLLRDEDTVITTNWDALIDFQAHTRGLDLNYGSSGVENVNYYGDEFERMDKVGEISLLKLHGSVNWLACPLCGQHYANVAKVIAMLKNRKWRECGVCGSEMDGVIETPTMIKAYRNAVIAEIWNVAVRKLVLADEWYFCGYSIPPDDSWILGMLLRAATGRCSDEDAFSIRCFVHSGENCAEADRYRQAFRLARRQLTVQSGGIEELTKALREP